MDRDAVVMNGHDLEKCVIAVSCRLSPDCVQNLPSASVHCRVTVGFLSGRIRENRDAVGTDLVIFTMRKKEIGSESYGELENRDEFGWKRLNRDAS